MGGRGSGGRNRKAPWQHIRDGTFRPARHGSYEAAAADWERRKRTMAAAPSGAASGAGRAVLAFPPTTGALALAGVPDPPDALLDGLGERGRGIALDLWTNYSGWTAARLVLLRELAIVADTLAGADLDLRLRFAAQRQYGDLFGKLDLRED